MSELVEPGTTFDVAIFQDSAPVLIVTLHQSQPNLVDCSVSEFSSFDVEAATQLLQMVVGLITDHAQRFPPDGDDPFKGAADFDIPF